MSSRMEKELAHKLVDQMPANATWDDLIYEIYVEIYVREVIERGLADSRTDRTKDVRDIRAKYGLPEMGRKEKQICSEQVTPTGGQ
jgi:hypothetical protein